MERVGVTATEQTGIMTEGTCSPRWEWAGDASRRRSGPYGNVLLTATADGIGCSFSVIAADIMSCHNDRFPGRDDRVPIRVQTLSSDDDGEWGHLAVVPNPAPPGSIPLNGDNDAGVVIDGVIHWLLLLSNHNILTYTVSTSTAGLIRLPVDRLPASWCVEESCLGSSPDGKLCLFTVDGLRVSIWMMSTSLAPTGGSAWTRRAIVDMWGTLRLMSIPMKEMEEHWIELESSGDQRTGAVLVRVHGGGSGDGRKDLVVLDMVTMRTRRVGEISGISFQVSPRSRVTAMRAV
ncbi:hypothetical protein QOZ80_2BG0164750 [Eleusine coracana subsp. coracana]|nr:hypothetical protein QOZ80_2BG0164750 [Eleusine coracana subsp. coracana]